MLENREKQTESKSVMDLFSRMLVCIHAQDIRWFTSSKRSQKGVKDKRRKTSLTLKD